MSLRSSWFKRRFINNLYDFYKKSDTFEKILNNTIKSIQVGGKNMIEDNLEDLKSKLPPHVLVTYILWLDGNNVVQIKTILGGGKRTKAGDVKYDRHSRELKKFGINTKVHRTNEIFKIKTNIIPLLRTLEATEAEAPEWMKKEGLVYTPKKHLLTSVEYTKLK